MAASSRLMIAEAERRFPVRIRIALPVGGFGERLNRMQAWLDQNAGADGWAMTPSGIRGVVNDAVAVHLADVAITSAFVARWCRAHRVEIVERSYFFTPETATHFGGVPASIWPEGHGSVGFGAAEGGPP
jgi:hypothetical protein